MDNLFNMQGTPTQTAILDELQRAEETLQMGPPAFNSPFSPSDKQRTPFLNVGNSQVGARMKATKSAMSNIVLPSRTAPREHSAVDPPQFATAADGGEPLIPIDEVCDALNATQEHMEGDSANPLSPINEMNESMRSQAGNLNASTMSDYGFGLNDSTVSTTSNTDYGFGPNASVYGLIGSETAAVSVEVDRVARSQQQNSDAHKVNEQIKNVGVGTLHTDGVEFARAKAVHSAHMVNEQVYATSHNAKFDGAAVEFQRAKDGQQLLEGVRMINQQMRGTHVGEQTAYGVGATQMTNEAYSQRTVADYRRINEQVLGVEAGTLPHDGVEFARAKTGQENVADVRMVNNQVRGEHAGEKTGYTTDAKQLVTESAAQGVVHSYMRVSEQARGELAGVPTQVDFQQRELQRHMGQQAQVSAYKAVNEQNHNSAVPTMPADAVDCVRTKDGQRLASEAGAGNEQVRGELAGQQTAFGPGARLLETEGKAQAQVSNYRRVNEQARGEFAGMPTFVQSDSQQIAAAAVVPKLDLVNDQIKHVGRGHFDTEAREYTHVRARQEELSRGCSERRATNGTSTYGHGAPEMSRVANAPKPAARNDQVRGEFAGTRTGFGADSMAFQRAKTAPKREFKNEQCRFGSSRTAKADTAAYNNTAEWRPASEQVGPADSGKKQVRIQAPPSPTADTNEYVRPGCSEFFGLKGSKSMVKKKNGTDSFTLARRSKSVRSTSSSSIGADAPSYADALSKFR